jgi:transcriptional regulator NrdR family protein
MINAKKNKNTTGRSGPYPLRIECVVKRGKEKICHAYDERKVYGSVYAACSVVGKKERECERTADKVSNHITKIVKNKREISSNAIAKQVVRELKKYDKHAAFMYETHRDVD